MNKYNERIKRIERHLVEHPHDYEAVFNLLEVRSRAYDYDKLKAYHRERKKIAEYEREGQQDE